MAGTFGRDWQQGRVYRWQWAHQLTYGAGIGPQVIGRAEQHALVNKVWRELACQGEPPRVTTSRGRCWYRMGEHRMCVPREANKLSILHETAHAIIRTNESTRWCVSHGPEFCAVFIRLCARYIGWDEDTARKHARMAGVTVAVNCPAIATETVAA